MEFLWPQRAWNARHDLRKNTRVTPPSAIAPTIKFLQFDKINSIRLAYEYATFVSLATVLRCANQSTSNIAIYTAKPINYLPKDVNYNKNPNYEGKNLITQRIQRVLVYYPSSPLAPTRLYSTPVAVNFLYAAILPTKIRISLDNSNVLGEFYIYREKFLPRGVKTKTFLFVSQPPR